MFTTAELGRSIPKQEYRQREPLLREELLITQRDLREANRSPVILVFAGVDGAGKGETVNLLNAWMDSRWIQTFAYEPPSDEEAQRPAFWRYWRDLPPKGQMGLFLSAWYHPPTMDWAHERIDEAELNRRLDSIVSFEDELVADGALILKFWMHLSREAQEKRLKALEEDPLQRWRVTETDWTHWEMYERFIDAAERIIARTSTGNAPWSLVEGTDANYRSLFIGEAIRDGIRNRLAQLAVHARVREELQSSDAPILETMTKGTLTEASRGSQVEAEGSKRSKPEECAEPLTVLSALDMGLTLDKGGYREALMRHQAQLSTLHREAKEQGISSIFLFEGPDAAGKGGSIRRLTAAMDARNYRVLPFAAPTDEERAHHYLWRFWRHMSRAGRVTVFDRSWYGRVLVERVEGFATPEEWTRAYAEINQFEEQLIEHGIVLLKFWIHITKEEQRKRFKAREKTPHKSWKLTAEDWRNREKWNEYSLAAHDMVGRTSTHRAPWILVEGNDKRYARIKVLREVCDGLERALTTEVPGG